MHTPSPAPLPYCERLQARLVSALKDRAIYLARSERPGVPTAVAVIYLAMATEYGAMAERLRAELRAIGVDPDMEGQA